MTPTPHYRISPVPGGVWVERDGVQFRFFSIPHYGSMAMAIRAANDWITTLKQSNP